jgi:hypothetical protein
MMRVCVRTDKHALANEEAAEKVQFRVILSEAQNLPWWKAKKKQVLRAKSALGMTILFFSASCEHRLKRLRKKSTSNSSGAEAQSIAKHLCRS